MEKKKTYLVPAIVAGFFVLTAIITLIIASYVSHHTDLDGIQSVLLVEPDGTERTYEQTKKPNDTVLLANLYINAIETEMYTIPLGTPIYRIEYRYADHTDIYTLCGFYENDSFLILLVGLDRTLEVSGDSKTAFLSSPISEAMYTSATLPQLFTASDETVKPFSMDWYYTDISGDFVKRKKVSTVTRENTYYRNDDISFTFDIQPDDINIEIRDDSKLLFSGTPDQLSHADIYNSGILQVTINAVWEERENRAYYGSADYRFRLEYIAPAVFSPSSPIAFVGGFLLINCENTPDSDKIRCQMMNDDTCSVTFFTYDHQVVGLVSVGRDSTPGMKTLRCSYLANSTDISFTVRESSFQSGHISYAPDDGKFVCLSQSIRKTTRSLLFLLGNTDAGYCFLSEPFALPVTGTEIIRYGDTVDVIDANESFTADYMEYAVAAGTAVRAMNSGNVLATGYDTFLGNYVVIGHGGGIQTWYTHLAGINVRSGETMIKGEAIGTAGSSGFAAESSVAIYVTVNGTITDPRYLLYSDAAIIK